MLSDAQIKSLIDYYIANQPTNWESVYVPLTALFVSGAVAIVAFLSFRTSREQLKSVLRHHIRTEWNGLMDACIKDGKFIDATFTHNYYERPHADWATYEGFCYRAWSLVDFIVRRKMHEEEKLYDAIISWVVAFHRTWLERNPFMFTDKEFWVVHDKIRAKPLMVLQNYGMPRLASDTSNRSDSVNWDEVSKDYKKWVLGPWAKAMMTADPKHPNLGNFLLDEVLKYQKTVGRDHLKILDFGCGPGNILDYLPKANISEISGLDGSDTALQIASEKANKLGIAFVPIHGDMRNYSNPTHYDIIISTNSILPEKSDDIRNMFETIFKLMKDDGRVFFILPAFDACAALVDYWRDYYRETWNNDEFVQRCVRAIEAAKKMDRQARLFADDGEHQQCFHTEQSIKDDLSACGFEIVGPIRRVSYPWDYAAKHDYGYFPGKPEIWDWYVEAKKKSHANRYSPVAQLPAN